MRLSRRSKLLGARTSISAGVVDDFPIDDRHGALRVQDLRRGNFHDVVGEHGKIGQLARLDGAASVFFERGVGGPNGEHFQCLLARHGLLGMPAFAGETLQIFGATAA